ncbi:MAG: DUF4876 domain-containing protein [Ignavibacteriaceae bacterium]|nr:DUF4876 domain-containing protein [Ignavibacteriaceae bacterium]
MKTSLKNIWRNGEQPFFMILIFSVVIFLYGCHEELPTTIDGNAKIELTAIWDTSSVENVTKYIPLINAKVILSSEYGVSVRTTDENGKLLVSGLPSSTYSISVRMPHPLDPNILLVGSVRDREIITGNVFMDTIIAKPISSSGISINEIYASGPVNSIYYFYDQFIELYNASDSVKYLDGMLVMRVSGNNDGGKGPGADEDDDNDMDGVTYVFKFPGRSGEQNYPFYPKSFLVLAQDAVNHKNTVSASIDLNGANWEFFNQFSANDIDNPNVPNLINLRSESTVDFMINLSSDVIVVSSGVDSIWTDGIDISNVIDGVEYQSTMTTAKTLDSRVDRGFVLSPAKYGGQSIQRREQGSDTNDATMDWEIIPKPTPGFQ